MVHLAGDRRLFPQGAPAGSLILCLILVLFVACRDNTDLATPDITLPSVEGEPGEADIPLNFDITADAQPPVDANLPATFTPLSTRAIVSLPTSIATIPACATEGKIETRSIASTIAGYAIPVRIYLPPCYGEDGRNYPVIYLLHGGSYDETHWTNLGLVEAAESGIESGVLPPVVIVMPGGGLLADTTSGGPVSYEGYILDELIPFIESNYCASPDGTNRAIGGISRGGYWALEIAFRFPVSFSSAGGHSAALLDSFAGPDINPQYTGLKNDLSGLRIYLDIGEQDWVIDNINLLHQEMEAAGISHTWVLNPGSHNDDYWATHVPEYLEWYTRIWSKDRHTFGQCMVTNAG